MNPFARLDHQHVWHPFTQMADWLRAEPIVISSGKGATLRDVKGREYIDANSSIWTNLHGHRHPKINRAIRRQLERVSHTSALGLANEPASLLAERLVRAAAPRPSAGAAAQAPANTGAKLEKVFYSDDGSTAVEVALKLAYEHSRRSGHSKQPRFVSMANAYHGDTIGAVSLGHISLFHKAYSQLIFKSDSVPSPFCYRCPHNRARPERADARETRKCANECLAAFERKFEARARRGRPYAGFVFEPLMQGAAGMIAQPEGWLRQAAGIARRHGALLIADEVMTGFGRTGMGGAGPESSGARLFACQSAGVRPDFLAVAKGLTGGYLPMAATLTTLPVFNSFLGDYSELKTFFHGHSFTGNQLGAAASLASLELLQTDASVRARAKLEGELRRQLATLWKSPVVGDIRQTGLAAGIELVRDWRTREPFALDERAGIRVCERMTRGGVLTRPIGNVIVLMPPYCVTRGETDRIFEALRRSLKWLQRSI
jgi:adenosylmethionine-8-amino-7-oxononanoate aminotransferase